MRESIRGCDHPQRPKLQVGDEFIVVSFRAFGTPAFPESQFANGMIIDVSFCFDPRNRARHIVFTSHESRYHAITNPNSVMSSMDQDSLDPGQLEGGEIRALMEIERAWDVMEQHRSTLLGYLAGTPNYAEEDMLVF
ncbi:hypothetical protein E4U46_007743 [Claviceps purpurea]|nr:hypothetical protein E4U46_007743 [Claviceps purpurea]